MANENALIAAASEGQVETVRDLIAAGADVNFRNDYRVFSLILAATQGHTEIVQVLIAAGADVNARDSYGYSSLILAANQGHTEIVRDLITAGADVNARTNAGHSALSLTRSNAIRQLLTDAGAVSVPVPVPVPVPAPAPAVTPEDRVSRLIENGQRPTRLFGVENLECPVCLDTDDNDKIAIVPCGHVFGRRCVEGVFRSNNIKCPECRGNIGGLYQVPPEEVDAAQAAAGQAGGKTRKLRRVSKCGGRTKHRKRHVKKSSCKRRKSILGRKSKKNSRYKATVA